MKRKIVKRNKQRITREIKELKHLAYLFFGVKPNEVKVQVSQKQKTIDFSKNKELNND